MLQRSTLLALLSCLICLACGNTPGTSEQAATTRQNLTGPAAPAAVDRGCALLDDPKLRGKLGGALENKLLLACGRAQRSSLAVSSEARAPSPVQQRPARRLAATVGSDIAVSNPSLDVGGSTQSETTVVAVGNVVCAAWNDAGEGFGSNGFAGYGYSLDGGQTFTDGGPFPAGPSGDLSFGDPSLAYSARDNAFYFASLSSAGLSLWRSSNNCQSFTYMGVIHSGFGDDKELMAVDNTPTSPFYGRLYVGWTDFGSSADINVATHSDDGLTWSEPKNFPGSGQAGQGVYPAVAPNGDVYMALVNRGFGLGDHQDQWLWRSTDGGESWQQRANIGTDQLQPEDQETSIDCGRQALNGDIRNLSSPQIVITPDAAAAAGYVIHAVYPYDADGTGPDHSDVFYRQSTDGAASWSNEVRLNDDSTTTDQFYPAIGVGETGILAVSFYDRRLDPVDNLLFDRYVTVSTDGGLSWSPNERMSDVSSDVAQTNPNFDGLATCYHGDYDQVAVSGNLAHLVWSDDRRVTETGPNPDVYYDQYVVNPHAGRIRGLQPLVSCSGVAGFSLSDSDLAGTGTHSVALTTSGGDSETLVLSEASDRPGTFSGSLPTASGSPLPNDGTLEVSDSSVITATYDDADDGSGKPATVTAIIRVDCSPPTLSNVRVSALAGDRATVSVDANEPAALSLEYGFSCDQLQGTATSNLSPTPSVSLSGLYEGVVYYYALVATDSVGNATRDDNGGSCYSFETLSLLSKQDFEEGDGNYVADNGPSSGGSGGSTGGSGPMGGFPSAGFGGKVGQPTFGDAGEPGTSGSGSTGGSSGSTEFDGLWHLSDQCAAKLEVGHTPSHAMYFGSDDTCSYGATGFVTRRGTVTSPPIQLSDARFATLEFQYFLGTEGGGFYDQASVEVSVNGGPFQTLGSNFTQLIQPDPDEPPTHRTRRDARPAGRYALVENSGVWQKASFDLSSLLQGLAQAQIAIRFRFDTVDGIANDFAGFYVDDVRVLGAKPQVPCSTDAECDDGAFCTGTETCQDGFCRNGLPVLCTGDDGIPCTDSVCDEAARGCVQRPNDAHCDDGLFCNGQEICSPTAGCQAGPPQVCSGGAVSCVVASCREDLKACRLSPNDAACDDGLFCTGQELCDPIAGCQSTGSPCVDGVACTHDSCDEATASCNFTPDNSLCDDGVFCDGSEYCDGFAGCRTSGPPCTAGQKCDEGGDQCLPICFTDTNVNHASQGRAYAKAKSYFAQGSNDSLGKGTETTSLQGSGKYWKHVPSCPAPPRVDSVDISVAGSVATISGKASDPNGDLAKVKVTVFLYYYLPVSFDATGTSNYSLSVDLPEGSHGVQVQAFDKAGFRSTVSDVYPIEVLPAVPPTIDSLGAQVNGSSVTVSGTASDQNNDIEGVIVTILKDGELVASQAASGTTQFSATISGLAAGSYTARAQAFDSAGFVSVLGDPVPFTITVVQSCISDTNAHHRSAGRATLSHSEYYARGSGDDLGHSGARVTALLGSGDYWSLVKSCP
jgi:hypothetical protein